MHCRSVIECAEQVHEKVRSTGVAITKLALKRWRANHEKFTVENLNAMRYKTSLTSEGDPMNKQRLFILSCVLCILTGCNESQENQQEVLAEKCSMDYVNDYNGVATAIQGTPAYWQNDSAMNSRGFYQVTENVYRACGVFFSRQSNTSCMAQMGSQTTMISSQNLVPYCENAQAMTQGQRPMYRMQSSQPLSQNQSYIDPQSDQMPAPPPFGGENPDSPVVVVPRGGEPLPSIEEQQPQENAPQVENETPQTLPVLPETPRTPETLPTLPQTPAPQVTTETPATPSTPEVPSAPATLPTLPTLPPTVNDANNTPVDDQTLISSIAVQRLRMTVTNVDKLLNGLGDPVVVFMQSGIGSLADATVTSKIDDGETYCQPNTVQREVWRQKLELNLIIPVVSISEVAVAGPQQSLTITLDNARTGITLTCLRHGIEPFRLGDIQKAISAVLTLQAP